MDSEDILSTYYHQHFQQLQKSTPTLQHSNVGEKIFDQDTNFGSSY